MGNVRFDVYAVRRMGLLQLMATYLYRQNKDILGDDIHCTLVKPTHSELRDGNGLYLAYNINLDLPRALRMIARQPVFPTLEESKFEISEQKQSMFVHVSSELWNDRFLFHELCEYTSISPTQTQARRRIMCEIFSSFPPQWAGDWILKQYLDRSAEAWDVLTTMAPTVSENEETVMPYFEYLGVTGLRNDGGDSSSSSVPDVAAFTPSAAAEALGSSSSSGSSSGGVGAKVAPEPERELSAEEKDALERSATRMQAKLDWRAAGAATKGTLKMTNAANAFGGGSAMQGKSAHLSDDSTTEGSSPAAGAPVAQANGLEPAPLSLDAATGNALMAPVVIDAEEASPNAATLSLSDKQTRLRRGSSRGIATADRIDELKGSIQDATDAGEYALAVALTQRIASLQQVIKLTRIGSYCISTQYRMVIVRHICSRWQVRAAEIALEETMAKISPEDEDVLVLPRRPGIKSPNQ